MPLSHKVVYKQPLICGDCNYDAENIYASGQPAGADHDGQSQNRATAADQDNGSVAFWSDPGSDPCSPGSPDNGAAEYGTENSGQNCQSEKAGSNGKSDSDVDTVKKVERLLEEKFEQCLRESYEQGLARADDECRSMREKAEAKLRETELTLLEAKHHSKEIIASSERKIVELAMAVAERLIYNQLDAAPETVTSIVRETMNMLNGGEHVDLYVNPADLALCLDYSDALKEEFKEITRLEVLPDPEMPRGSCRIESESGVAEYLIDEEKEQLKAMLLKIARSEEEQQVKEDDFAYDRH